MDVIFVAAAAILYCAAAVLIITKIIKSKGNQFVAYACATVGCVLHLITLIQGMPDVSGQDMSITNVLSLVAWLICVAMLVSHRLLPNTVLMPGVYVFSALALLFAFLLPTEYSLTIALTPGLTSHITLSLLAYGCLTIGFLYALQMMFITNKLKHKGAALLTSPLPPLLLVESVLFKLIMAGTALLCVGLLSGFVFLDDMFSKQYAHKTVLSLLALVVYLLLLSGQHFWGWKNKHIVMLTSLGLTLLTLAYFGSRLVREIILKTF